MANYVFGIDVGGTSVKCGLFQTDGTLLEKWEIPTRTENGGSEILPDIAKSVKAKMAEKGIAADDVAMVNGGTGTYITSGKAIDVTWSKDDPWGVTKYRDSNGEEIKLNLGKTWVLIVLDNYADETEIR